MDRSLPSATSSAAATHKRQPSTKNGSKSTTSVVIALFVTNLRLLDLDLLPDWPQITAQSLSNGDARLRIKCAEYALFQLHRLYDPAATADKLQPFFPPLEPLQSVNLRAALFRCLTELKKNGVLAREAVLRKTMLDDCQGDKFWELCLAFSAVVLRKQSLKGKTKHGRPIAQRLALATSLSKSQAESMLPMAIAHRAALNRVLQEKARKRENFVKLSNLLREKEAELQDRRIRAQMHVTASLSPERLRAVEQAVEKSWIGSTDLKEALIGGDVCASGDGLLLRSFENLWRSSTNEDDSQSFDSGAEMDFLQALRDGVSEQNRRLRRWQNYHDKLVASKPRSGQTSNRSSASVKPVIRFDRHRDLIVRDKSPSGERGRRQKHERHDSVLKYDEILTAMRDELRKTVTNQGGAAAAAAPTPILPPPMRRASTQPLAPGRSSVIMDSPAKVPHGHRRSPSQTAVPMWPRMGSRTPSRSRSYQQPKVVSQREPIPLKSELFSPLKDKRRSSAGSSSILASPAEDDEVTRSPRSLSSFAMGMDRTALAALTSNEDSGAGLGISTSGASRRESAQSTASRTGDADGESDPSSITPRPGVDRTYTAPVPIMRPSLAERTRMSMVFQPRHGDDDDDNTPRPHREQQQQQPVSQGTSPSPSEYQSPLSTTNGFSLVERTRQSIFLAPRPSSKTNPTGSLKKPSPTFPVNQFETPTRPRAFAHTPVDSLQPSSSPSPSEGDDDDDRESARAQRAAGGKAHRDVTPLEQLLSPEAEYDSVFKSRPRVVHSPRSSSAAEVEFLG